MTSTDVPCARCGLNRATVTFAPVPDAVAHYCSYCIRAVCTLLTTGRP